MFDCVLALIIHRINSIEQSISTRLSHFINGYLYFNSLIIINDLISYNDNDTGHYAAFP